jgi:hypothetical protein
VSLHLEGSAGHRLLKRTVRRAGNRRLQDLVSGLLFFLATLTAVLSSAPQSSPRPAVPLDPIAAILDAFRSHSVVALAEGNHGNEQGHAFRLSLIRDPRFAATVNDIVVEFGSARYQDLMDRFVRGDAIPDDALRQVWRNTAVAQAVWDAPIYEEFFRAVRAVNASLPRERRLRVLLGDPPLDWNVVHSREDLDKQVKDMARDRYPADLIRREVLAKRRHALLIYGDGHLSRKDILLNFDRGSRGQAVREVRATRVDRNHAAEASPLASNGSRHNMFWLIVRSCSRFLDRVNVMAMDWGS